MRGRIVIVSKSTGESKFFIDDREVTKEEFDRAFPPREVGVPGGHSTAWANGLESDALAVHPSQIGQAMARNKRHGLHIDYTKDGRPILKDRGQRRDLMRVERVHDNQGGYGD